MIRFAIAVWLFHASQCAFAAPAAGNTAPLNAILSTSAAKSATGAEPDKLLPPLPPLASLPASATQDVEEEAHSPRSVRSSKKTVIGRARSAKPSEPVVRIVVSPESRTYLTSMSSKLDAMLRGATSSVRSGSNAIAVAMTR